MALHVHTDINALHRSYATEKLDLHQKKKEFETR